MAGLLDDAMNAYWGDNTQKDEFGMTQADRRQPIWDTLLNSGLLAVAAGGNLMPAERARYIAAAGGALGGMTNEMMQQRSQAAQQMLRSQQITAGQAELAQQQKWRDLANDPKVQEELKDLDPASRQGAIIALTKGDTGTYRQILADRKPKVQTDTRGNTNITYPDGSVAQTDAFGRSHWLYRAPGSKLPDQPPSSGATATTGDFDQTAANVGGTERLNLGPLQGVPHEVAVQALQVARGEIAPPTVRTNPQAAMINMLASQIAGPNGTSFATRQQFEKSITSGGITDRQMIAPWSKMMQHGEAAQRAYDELQHRDGGKWAGLLDKGTLNLAMIKDPDVLRIATEFQTEMRNYVQEGQKLIAGSGMLSDAARAEVQGVDDPSKPPAMQIGHMQAFANMTKPVMDQILANGRRVRHDSTIELKDLGINPDSLKARDYLEQRFRSGPGTASATTASSYVGPDGKAVSAQDIADTAKAEGITPDQVIKKYGLRPGGK